MKSDVFDQYVERVINLFSITKEEFFSKSKKREFVDARHLVYYLCNMRPMQISYIQRYMNQNEYKIEHSSIIHGIASVKKKIEDDDDYLIIIKEMYKSVFI
jgi:chromosomal replication initiation ATPase DnaA